MGYQTLALGLTLTIPTPGTRNWAQTLYATTWTKISAHDHTGGGNGAQLGTNALLDLSVKTAKIDDLAVTTAKIDDLAVTTAKIADLSVITAKIDDLAVTNAKLAALAVTSDKLAANIAFTQAATLTPAGSTETIDFDSGMIWFINLGSATGDVTLTLSNPVAGASYKVFLTQGATARDIIWPASVKWPQGQKPILSTVNGSTDSVYLYYDGTSFYADWQLNYS